jgi:hypothetical protein
MNQFLKTNLMRERERERERKREREIEILLGLMSGVL